MKKFITLIITLQCITTGVSGQTADPLDPLQGGENVANAFVLSDPLPIISLGTTEGYLDDYDESCPYPGDNAPDVVYAYTPVSDVTVDIDLCGSSFDTKVYLYENAVTPGIPYECDDDYYTDTVCGLYVSKIESLFLTGGNTYYIVIDGYDEFAYGDYSLEISENSLPPPCTWDVDIICPQDALTEGETCGTDTNGGCEMAAGTENWETIPTTGATFCGTLWANGGSRDTDQYELLLTETSLVILTVDADQLIQFGLISGGTAGYVGNPDCTTITGISPSNTAGPCYETILDLGLLLPGTYWFSVSMTVNDGFPCDNHYWIDFDVIPQPCPPPVELTAENITATSASLSWTESGTAADWEYQIGLSGFTPAESGTSTTLNPQPVSGLSANSAYDFYIRAFCDPAFSNWEGPFSFTTLCGSSVSVPWNESFESAWPPYCWVDTETADYGWSQSTYGSAHDGVEWAYCNLSGSSLSTPEFYLASHSVLSFWIRAENILFPQDFSVKIGNDLLYQVSSATNESYKPVQISLADYTGQTVFVTFLSESGGGGSGFGLCLDDVSVKVFNTWTGNNSSAWNDNANWSLGSIPTQADAILIPSVPSGNNFPVISGGITAECDHITILPGATLVVVSGNSLDIKNP